MQGKQRHRAERGTAYQPVLNTTDFVRNVDLAWDLGKFFLDKLGIDTDKFVENFNKVKEIIF